MAGSKVLPNVGERHVFALSTDRSMDRLSADQERAESCLSQPLDPRDHDNADPSTDPHASPPTQPDSGQVAGVMY